MHIFKGGKWRRPLQEDVAKVLMEAFPVQTRSVALAVDPAKFDAGYIT